MLKIIDRSAQLPLSIIECHVTYYRHLTHSRANEADVMLGLSMIQAINELYSKS
jgi:hypothetical protein